MDLSKFSGFARDLAMLMAAPVIGGIGFLFYTVPDRLDQVLSNRAEIQKIEPQLQKIELRLTALEAKQEAK